jgi:hypothetical protein
MDAFDKTCPQCSAANSAGAVMCECGYLFNPMYLKDPELALEIAIREETLIEEYLTARAEQAIEAARTAAHDAAMVPGHEQKAAQAASAQHAAVVAQAELTQQCVRTAEAQGRLDAYRHERHRSRGEAVEYEGDWRALVVAEALKAKSVRRSVASRYGDAHATPSARAGPAFKATQAARAEAAMKTAPELGTTRCPACDAALTAGVAHCQCGWSASMSISEVARLRARGGDGHDSTPRGVQPEKPPKSR